MRQEKKTHMVDDEKGKTQHSDINEGFITVEEKEGLK